MKNLNEVDRAARRRAIAYLKRYFALLVSVLCVVGLLNFIADPLWYGSGSRLGVNPPWNERLSKTNLFLRTRDRYNCLLLGTSRSTLFHMAHLQQHRCFNYAFSGGRVEELANYAQFVQAQGGQPQRLYVEVDPDSFNRRGRPRQFAPVTRPEPWYRPYLFSLNTVWLSLRTLAGIYPHARIYDRAFAGQVSPQAGRYEPEFAVENANNRGCDRDRLRFYQAIQQAFPAAELVAFVPPMSAWRVYNNRYANGLLGCQTALTHELAKQVTALYDFSIPAAWTQRTDNTYDGNHYLPSVYADIADVLEGRRSDLGIRVAEVSLPAYQALYTTRLQSFLQQVGAGERAARPTGPIARRFR